MVNNTLLFLQKEREMAFSGEELVNELSKVTLLPIMPRCKLLVIDYLMKHYFATDKEEEMPENMFLS
jgi:hypothetical protein